MPHDESSTELVTIPVQRLQVIDHTTRNTAQTISDLAHEMSLLGKAMTREQQAMSADRVKIEALYGPNGAVATLERKVEQNQKALEAKVDTLQFKLQRKVEQTNSKLEKKFDDNLEKLANNVVSNHDETMHEVGKLRDFMTKCAGIATGVGATFTIIKLVLWMWHSTGLVGK